MSPNQASVASSTSLVPEETLLEEFLEVYSPSHDFNGRLDQDTVYQSRKDVFIEKHGDRTCGSQTFNGMTETIENICNPRAVLVVPAVEDISDDDCRDVGVQFQNGKPVMHGRAMTSAIQQSDIPTIATLVVLGSLNNQSINNLPKQDLKCLDRSVLETGSRYAALNSDYSQASQSINEAMDRKRTLGSTRLMTTNVQLQMTGSAQAALHSAVEVSRPRSVSGTCSAVFPAERLYKALDPDHLPYIKEGLDAAVASAMRFQKQAIDYQQISASYLRSLPTDHSNFNTQFRNKFAKGGRGWSLTPQEKFSLIPPSIFKGLQLYDRRSILAMTESADTGVKTKVNDPLKSFYNNDPLITELFGNIKKVNDTSSEKPKMASVMPDELKTEVDKALDPTECEEVLKR